MAVTGCPEICPTCHALTYDGLAHFLQAHPGRDVPRSVVLAWIRKDPGRCARCYERVPDAEVHRQGHHVSSVYLRLGRVGYRETVVRGDDGLFACPWCPEKRRFADLFKVRWRRHSVRNPTPQPPTHRSTLSGAPKSASRAGAVSRERARQRLASMLVRSPSVAPGPVPAICK